MEFVGVRDRRGDVGLGLLARGDDVAPLGQPRRDRRRQRAAGAVRVLGLYPFRRQADDFALADQQIDAVVAFAKIRSMAAFDQHIARAERQNLARLHFHFAFVTRLAGAGERGRLRQIGRHHQRARDELAAHHLEHVAAQQAVAGRRGRHRVEHDVVGAVTREPRRHRLNGRRTEQHADLHRIDREIGKDGVDLGADETGRHVVDRVHALRILRGERGDDACPIHPERGEGLQVRLDAGAAARIRTGDGDGNRGHGLFGQDLPRRASAPSTAARNSCAAFAGSAARDSAEITATPSAPAAIVSPALLALMPEMAQIGNPGLRARTACAMARRPAMPIGALASVLRAGGVHRANADIIEKLERSGLRLFDAAQAQPDDGRAPEQQARIGHRHIVLSDMHAVGFGRERDIDAVIDQQRHAGRLQHVAQGSRFLHHGARAAVLVAQLHQRRAAGDQGSEIGERPATGDGGIDKRIEAEIHVHQVTFAKFPRAKFTRAYAMSVGPSRL